MTDTSVNLKELLELIPDILKVGITGFGTVLGLLTFILILKTNLSPRARKFLIGGFMFFSVVLFAMGIFSFSFQRSTGESRDVNPSDTTAKVLDATVPIGNSVGAKTQEVNFYSGDELWSYIDQNKENINELYIAGAHLQNGVGKILGPLTTILQRGAKVSVVFVNVTDSAVVALQAQRDVFPNTEGIKLKIRRTIDQLVKLRREIPNANLEWRMIDWPVDERIHIINPRSDGSRIYVKLYPYKHEYLQGVDDGGVFFYTVKEQRTAMLYNYYLEKFVRYFEAGKPYVVTN